MDNFDLPKEGFCRDKAFYSALGISRSKFWDLVKKGKLPQPVKFGRNTLWCVDDARRVIAEVRAGLHSGETA